LATKAPLADGKLDPDSREARVKSAQTQFAPKLSATITKIVLLGLFDALMIYTLMMAIGAKSWVLLVLIAVVTLAVNVIYLPPNRMLPGKYLAPGIIFLIIFAVSVTLYTVIVSFTNYGDGHNSTKQDAIVAIQKQNQQRVQDSPEFPAAVATKDGALWLLIVDPSTDQVRAGSEERPLQDVDDAEVDSLGRPKAARGFNVLSFADISSRQSEIAELSVPVSEDTNEGFLRTTTGSVAYQYRSTMHYDKDADTFTSPDGKTYRDGGAGAYIDDNGNQINPGWRIGVGFDNYKSALTEPSIREPFLRVLAWTFAFAILSVLTTFALGLGLAMVFNVKLFGQRFYRVIMILPYAFPAIMMTMVWAGMFNRDFGFINQVLFGGSSIPWLTDPFLAKVSLLIVNLWLGFPYQFLVASAALTSIPHDVVEAAEVDGATSWQIFRTIKLPLLMVSLAPLLISSFAFNFNNFNLVYMLTKGGPRMLDTNLDVGSSDILISMVYKVAFGDASRLYGLGSAFAVLIFIIVGVISAIGFRQTRALEDLNS